MFAVMQHIAHFRQLVTPDTCVYYAVVTVDKLQSADDDQAASMPSAPPSHEVIQGYDAVPMGDGGC